MKLSTYAVKMNNFFSVQKQRWQILRRRCIIEHVVGLCSLLSPVISSGRQHVQWGDSPNREWESTGFVFICTLQYTSSTVHLNCRGKKVLLNWYLLCLTAMPVDWIIQHCGNLKCSFFLSFSFPIGKNLSDKQKENQGYKLRKQAHDKSKRHRNTSS